MQQIQERNISFAILEKAQVLVNTWRRLEAKSLSLLQSIINIVAQRAATMELPSTLEKHGVGLSNLVYKQTNAMENYIEDLKSVLDMFEKVNSDWRQLDLEATRHLNIYMSKPIAPTKPAPLSTSSLIQVTAVTPIQTHDMISQLCYMYNEAFSYKSILLSTLTSHLSNQDQLQNLIDRWDAETQIDTSVQDILFERVKLYKTVKKVLESVD